MDADAETKVLESLYDRLYDAITYAPPGRPTGLDAKPQMLMAKNLVLNPADFTNALSPMNPGQSANQNAAEAFSAMVDAIPDVSQGTLWVDSGRKVSEVYSNAVNGANTSNQVNPAQKKIYDQAYAYLNVNQTLTNFDGTTTTTAQPSAIAQAYDDNESAYITAVGGYRAAYNGYDLSQPADQRQWNAVAPGLQNLVDQTWNHWTRQGKQQVEQAQNALQSTINDAVAGAIAQAQGLVAPTSRLPSALPNVPPWLLSYGMASDWMQASSQAAQLTLRSSYINQTASAEATSYSTGGNASWGLWNAGGSSSHDSAEQHSHMDAQDFTLTAELIQVRIMRPWFNPLLFSMKDWWSSAYDAGGLSADTVMPLVPTSFIVARNVAITADFSDADKSHFQDSTSSSASVGWGPFSVSGSYSHSSSSDTYSSHYDGGTLYLPGLQLLAFVCASTPTCPPLAKP
jgi:hypothetical protein